MKVCTACNQPADLRPYGVNGALVCFDCAMSTPESTATAEQQFASQLAACGNVAVIGEDVGPYPLANAAPELRALLKEPS